MSDDVSAKIDATLADGLLDGATVEWHAISGPTEAGNLATVVTAGDAAALAAVSRAVTEAREFEAAREQVNEVLRAGTVTAAEMQERAEVLGRLVRSLSTSGTHYEDRTGPDGVTRSWARCYAVPITFADMDASIDANELAHGCGYNLPEPRCIPPTNLTWRQRLTARIARLIRRGAQ